MMKKTMVWLLLWCVILFALFGIDITKSIWCLLLLFYRERDVVGALRCNWNEKIEIIRWKCVCPWCLLTTEFSPSLRVSCFRVSQRCSAAHIFVFIFYMGKIYALHIMFEWFAYTVYRQTHTHTLTRCWSTHIEACRFGGKFGAKTTQHTS